MVYPYGVEDLAVLNDLNLLPYMRNIQSQILANFIISIDSLRRCPSPPRYASPWSSNFMLTCASS